MEEYLQYMKTLRTQMNDVEDQAAKISVEEQMQITTIHTLEKDLSSAKLETKRLMDDTELMVKSRGDICSKILENQKRISSLESDTFSLAQTLELIQQERSNLSTKLLEKSAYYAKVVEDMTSKLHEQQDWVDNKFQYKVSETTNIQTDVAEETLSKDHHVACNMGDEDEELRRKLRAANIKLDELMHARSNLVSENCELEHSVGQLKHAINHLSPELSAMDVLTLEEEHKAALSEKGGEIDYMKSLQSQLEKFRGISHVVKCACGGEYKVEMSL